MPPTAAAYDADVKEAVLLDVADGGRLPLAGRRGRVAGIWKSLRRTRGLQLMILPGLRESWWRDGPPLYELTTTPISAVDWLAAHDELPGPIWNDYAFGSYLEFALPSRPTWIDTRMYSYPPEQWDEYVSVSRGENWQDLFDREGVNLLLLATASQSGLIEGVSSSDLWCEKYRDEYAVIFTRCEPVP